MGLSALFDDNSSDVQVKKTLRISEIEPNRLQPRKNFNEEAIASLAESVKEHGIIQPLLVRPYNNSYQIVAGERRWRAAKMLDIEEVPVIIKELSDAEAMQLALIENLQREDLNPIEEASGYKELVETYNMKQEELGKLFGKSRSSVSNLMRLLNLPEEVQEYLKEGLVTVGHAKILLGVEDKVVLLELADRVAQGRLTVRQLEVIVTGMKQSKSTDSEEKDRANVYYQEMEISLKDILGRKVSVKHKGNDKGTLVLEFYDKEDLRALADKLAK